MVKHFKSFNRRLKYTTLNLSQRDPLEALLV